MSKSIRRRKFGEDTSDGGLHIHVHPKLKERIPQILEDRERYWEMRNQLLKDYEGKWIAFHAGKVLEAGDDPLEVSHEAAKKNPTVPSFYFTQVGCEDKIKIRIRRESIDPEIEKRIIPEFWKDREAYWAAHDELLKEYKGRWVAFLADKGVIATGENMMDVSRKAFEINPTGAYIAKVGEEDKIIVKCRRSNQGEFGSKMSYDPSLVSAIEKNFYGTGL